MVKQKRKPNFFENVQSVSFVLVRVPVEHLLTFIRIGKENLQHDLVSSPFPLLHTVREPFGSHGDPS